MNSDWRPVPDATETLADGRRREWACRDISAPATVPVADVELDSDPPSRPGHGFRRRQAQAQIDDVDLDAIAQLRIDNARAGRDFERNTITTAKQLGIWKWVVLVFGLGSIGWGAWVSIRGGAGSGSDYPQTQPGRDVVEKYEPERLKHGAGGGAGGTNHCRELLVKWLRSSVKGSLTDEEIAEARRAVEADR